MKFHPATIFCMAAIILTFASAETNADDSSKKREVPKGFDRPLVIDRKMERDIAALTKRVAALEKAVKSKSDGQSDGKMAKLQREVASLNRQIRSLSDKVSQLDAKVKVLSRKSEE